MQYQEEKLSDEFIERLLTAIEKQLLCETLQEALPPESLKCSWPSDVDWPEGTPCEEVFSWLGEHHSRGERWLREVFLKQSLYARKGGGLHFDAPPVPIGLRPRQGVEVGCGDPNCSDCYEPDTTLSLEQIDREKSLQTGIIRETGTGRRVSLLAYRSFVVSIHNAGEPGLKSQPGCVYIPLFLFEGREYGLLSWGDHSRLAPGDVPEWTIVWDARNEGEVVENEMHPSLCIDGKAKVGMRSHNVFLCHYPQELARQVAFSLVGLPISK